MPLDRVNLAMVANESWRWAEGQSVAAAAERAGLSPGEFICEILVASDMEVGVVAFRPGSRTEADIRAVLRHPAHMAGSDGIFRGGSPHPRGWGAFARYLGRHTRELGDYTWSEAITHLATHAARRFRLTERGLIRAGYVADIAVFDPATIIDKATYAHGLRWPRAWITSSSTVRSCSRTASRLAPRPDGRCGGGDIGRLGRPARATRLAENRAGIVYPGDVDLMVVVG